MNNCNEKQCKNKNKFLNDLLSWGKKISEKHNEPELISSG